MNVTIAGASFLFDAPTGTWRSQGLSEKLLARARGVGPVFAYYAPVSWSPLHEDKRTEAALQVLVYQARWLRSLRPEVVPELRAGMATDFGRRQCVCWYAPEYEDLIPEVMGLPAAIDPLEVV
jgi:hypothetical protein